MHKIPIILVAAAALGAALPGCGGEASSSTGPRAASLSAGLVPVFDSHGFLERDPATDLPVYELEEGATPPARLRPLFEPSGRVMRCPETGCPLYLLENGSTPCLVRLGGS